MASRGDLQIYQGDDYAATVSVQYRDGAAVDLTGYTAEAQIRRDVADKATEVLVQIGVTVGTSSVALAIPHAQTAALAGGSYRWDLQLIGPDGEVTTVIAGKVEVTAEITRAIAV